MGKILGQNPVIRFSHRRLASGRKSSKTVITREGQRMETNSPRLRLVSSSSTNWYRSRYGLALTFLQVFFSFLLLLSLYHFLYDFTLCYYDYTYLFHCCVISFFVHVFIFSFFPSIYILVYIRAFLLLSLVRM